MTFWEFIDNHKTKMLGTFVAASGFVSAATASGMFTGLLEPTTVQWLGIGSGLVTAAFGGGTYAAGRSNTTKERVAQAAATVEVAKAHQADAMKTAIESTPGPR